MSVTVSTDEIIDLLIDRPAVGGRMIGRYRGRIALVGGAIPGERVQAIVEGVRRGALFARTVSVLEGSPDRRSEVVRPSCGGRSFAHIAYSRQLQLKSAIIQDAFRRIGRIHLDVTPFVVPSPEIGYRMRARLRVDKANIGFIDEQSHSICDVDGTGQLLPDTECLVGALAAGSTALADVGARSVELTEDLIGGQCALHVLLEADHDKSDGSLRELAASVPGVTGLSVSSETSTSAPRCLFGTPHVWDEIESLLASNGAKDRVIRRHAASFFQANRYLVPRLVEAVTELIGKEKLVDLYSGVGLFSVSLACRSSGSVVAVERDPISSRDLLVNGAPFGSNLSVVCTSAEAYLKDCGSLRRATVIVDPPRIGLTRECVSRLVGRRPQRIVYVSCDVATQARDLRSLMNSGYLFRELSVFDMFPNTPHIEAVATLDRARETQA